MSVSDDDFVQSEFRRAWQESQPGTTVPHEEGGFILRDLNGGLVVERWPRGVQNEISVPPHPGGRYGDLQVVATFHTHPNPGPNFQQEPSLTDIRAIRDDPELSHAEYEGEYVIASEDLYRVCRNGDVEVVGSTRILLKLSQSLN
ncbi:MAG TPA: hypothetical protein VK850_00665 [Candidatus Binatia bacterium]|nr:hypothetical protein [Candidatus Binatia bacterium]